MYLCSCSLIFSKPKYICICLKIYLYLYLPKNVYLSISCRILRSVLLTAAVIVVRPVLIIEVDTHWRQVKGRKSYLTLSGGSRSHGQTVHLLRSLCWCHSVDITLIMSTVNVTSLISLCISKQVDFTLLILFWKFHSFDVTLLMSLYWCHSVDVNLLMPLY